MIFVLVVFVACSPCSSTIGSVTVPIFTDIVVRNKSEKFVNDIIVTGIGGLTQDIIDSGYDPYYVDHAFGYYTLTELLNFRGMVNEFNVSGLSNIKIRQVDFYFNDLSFLLGIDVVKIKVAKIEINLEVLGIEFNGVLSGSMQLLNVTLSGELRVGVLGGVNINNLKLNLNIGTIKSNIKITVQDSDFSTPLNNFLQVTVPKLLREFKVPINQLIVYYLGGYIKKVLDFSSVYVDKK